MERMEFCLCGVPCCNGFVFCCERSEEIAPSSNTNSSHPSSIWLKPVHARMAARVARIADLVLHILGAVALTQIAETIIVSLAIDVVNFFGPAAMGNSPRNAMSLKAFPGDRYYEITFVAQASGDLADFNSPRRADAIPKNASRGVITEPPRQLLYRLFCFGLARHASILLPRSAVVGMDVICSLQSRQALSFAICKVPVEST